jgi:hypothetical protein
LTLSLAIFFRETLMNGKFRFTFPARLNKPPVVPATAVSCVPSIIRPWVHNSELFRAQPAIRLKVPLPNSEFRELNIRLTQVAATCSVAFDGGFPTGFPGIRGSLFDGSGLPGVCVSAPLGLMVSVARARGGMNFDVRLRNCCLFGYARRGP